MNRRQALHLGAALVTGGWLGKLLPGGSNTTSCNTSETFDVDPNVCYVEAADLARMESRANRQRNPRTWPLLAYDGILQFSKTHVLLYGYGRPGDVQAARARWVAYLDDPDLDAATSGDGRAWAILTTGLLSEDTQREQHAAWAERERGQRLLEIYVRREEHRRRDLRRDSWRDRSNNR